jgi:hypothetical protein
MWFRGNIQLSHIFFPFNYFAGLNLNGTKVTSMQFIVGGKAEEK